MLGTSWDDPRTMATFNLAAGLLGGGNFGQALGRGLQGYTQHMQQAEEMKGRKEDRAARKLLTDMQMEQMLQAAQKQKAQDAWRAQVSQLMNPEAMTPQGAINQPGRVGPTAGKAEGIGQTPAVDQAALMRHLLDPNSPFADELIKQKIFPEKPKQHIVDGHIVQMGANGPEVLWAKPEKIDPNKPFMVQDGKIVPNTAFQDYDIRKATAGASRVNTTVNTGNTIDSTIAKGVGEQVNNSLSTARSAEAQIGTLNNLRQALDSGKLFAGPTSNFQQYGAQLADVLGIAGKDTKEKLVNTRLAMQSMAQLELDAAEQMRGQGAITENERGIIRRAAAGEIDKMTTTELRTLTDALTKIASNKIERHNQYAAPVVQRNETLGPMLTVQPPSVYQWQNSVMRQPQAPQQQGGFRIIGVE